MKYQNFHSKLPFFTYFKISAQCTGMFALCYLPFDEIIIILTKLQKLKTVFVKQMHSLQEYCGADSIGF